MKAKTTGADIVQRILCNGVRARPLGSTARCISKLFSEIDNAGGDLVNANFFSENSTTGTGFKQQCASDSGLSQSNDIEASP